MPTEIQLPIVLLPAELEEITGYKRAVGQKRHFDALGIPARIRPDNTLSVIRAHVDHPARPQSSGDNPKRVRLVRKVA